MPVSVTPIYAAVLAIAFIALSLRVIRMRYQAKVGLGDGGNETLARRQRAHGNFAEYVPLVLVLMALAELQGSPAASLHLIGGLLVAGRLLHVIGLDHTTHNLKARVTGMVFTFAALLSGALACLGIDRWLLAP